MSLLFVQREPGSPVDISRPGCQSMQIVAKCLWVRHRALPQTSQRPHHTGSGTVRTVTHGRACVAQSKQ